MRVSVRCSSIHFSYSQLAPSHINSRVHQMLDLIEKHKGVNAYEILVCYPLEALAHMDSCPNDLLSQEFARIIKLMDEKRPCCCHFCCVRKDVNNKPAIEAVVKTNTRDYWEVLPFCSQCWETRLTYVRFATPVSSFRNFLELMYRRDPKYMWMFVRNYCEIRDLVEICYPQDLEQYLEFEETPPLFIPDISRGRSQLPCYAVYENNLEYFERQRSKLAKSIGSPAGSASNADS